jgi:hypothetical protein
VRLHAEHLEEVAGNPSALDDLTALAAHETHRAGGLSRQAGKDRVAIAERREQRVRERMQAVAVLVPEPSALHAELHELAGVLDREETKEDLVEERENRSVGGDAEGERQHSGYRETWGCPHQTHPVAKILSKLFSESRDCHALFDGSNRR